MLKLKREIWSRNDKEKFVLLPFEEYEAVCRRLEDAEDFRLLEESKIRQAGAPTISLAQMKRRLGIGRKRKAGGK